MQEVIVVDPDLREVHCYELPSAERVSASTALDVVMTDLTAAIDWP